MSLYHDAQRLLTASSKKNDDSLQEMKEIKNFFI
jgi:hypothetical protein